MIKENLFFEEISTLLILRSYWLNLSRLRKLLFSLESLFSISPLIKNLSCFLFIFRLLEKKSILFVVKLMSLKSKFLFSILSNKLIFLKLKSFNKFIFPSFNNPLTL